MNLLPVIESLRVKRPIFHSEADFQFAFAWEIKYLNPTAEIRLEYSPLNEPNKHIDILVWKDGFAYPIELKYKTTEILATNGDEVFSLKEHGAFNLGAYDFVKDICRVESFVYNNNDFKKGFALWLTNEPKYWNAPKNQNAGYAAFSVHNGARKSGLMNWGSQYSAKTKKRRKELLLSKEYEINWNDYSKLSNSNGTFKFALICVD